MANDFITQQSLDDFHKAKNRARMHSLFGRTRTSCRCTRSPA